MDRKIKHLEFIQGVINRLASDSFRLKGWSVVLVSALFVLSAREGRLDLVSTAFVPGKETAGFVDAADFEEVEKGGDAAVKKWIREQLGGTSVTVVLVGSHTCASRYVQYEIDQSKDKGNGLLGIDISKIKDLAGDTTERCGKIPSGYSFYLWNEDDGRHNMGDWIEDAARAAGR